MHTIHCATARIESPSNLVRTQCDLITNCWRERPEVPFRHDCDVLARLAYSADQENQDTYVPDDTQDRMQHILRDDNQRRQSSQAQSHSADRSMRARKPRQCSSLDSIEKAERANSKLYNCRSLQEDLNH